MGSTISFVLKTGSSRIPMCHKLTKKRNRVPMTTTPLSVLTTETYNCRNYLFLF
jgi:hypothetical protein